MHGCSAFFLPSMPRPEFVEPFGTSVVEKMLAGGPGPVVTTETGGLPEATGGHCFLHEAGDVEDLRARIEEVGNMPEEARRNFALQGRAYALRFDRKAVFSRILQRLDGGLDKEPEEPVAAA
jgi:Glycosyltransferase